MFNPQSRWDRPTPKAKKDLHQAIEVAALFSPGKIKPLYLTLNKQRYEIERINYFWKDYRGALEKLYCFSVTSGANIFNIYFSNHSLSWRLAKIE
ncbi:MAG: hypothetical protein JW714_02740 [Candidatus Omnitrophica bacterium]|nr:hypothetical protein [Candidatus Omnitrophota bacterium]